VQDARANRRPRRREGPIRHRSRTAQRRAPHSQSRARPEDRRRVLRAPRRERRSARQAGRLRSVGALRASRSRGDPRCRGAEEARPERGPREARASLVRERAVDLSDDRRLRGDRHLRTDRAPAGQRVEPEPEAQRRAAARGAAVSRQPEEATRAPKVRRRRWFLQQGFDVLEDAQERRQRSRPEMRYRRVPDSDPCVGRRPVPRLGTTCRTSDNAFSDRTTGRGARRPDTAPCTPGTRP
jgi:hypothetical protein